MGIKTDHNALTARAAKYGISIREDGHLTKPAQYADVPDDAFADPVNYAYPMDTPRSSAAHTVPSKVAHDRRRPACTDATVPRH
jgi:hypothetical protein